MRLSMHSGSVLHASAERCIAEARRAADAGLTSYWAPMLAGLDSLTMLAVIGSHVPGIGLGTAVAPIPLRLPFAMAQQAKTIQAVTDGRLTLGLGTSHASMVREIFGGEWEPPIPAMRSYLAALRDLLVDGAGPAANVSVTPPPLILGALNPDMARLAAEQADGIVTWAAGPRTLEEVVIPATAGRPGGTPFRIIAVFPLAVTGDVALTRARVHKNFGSNDELPSYRKVREREGGRGIADIAVIGDESAVAEELTRFAELGVTEFAANIVARSAEDEDRTWEFLTKASAHE
jgi:5,10-methylenetetrahydromethanopterin reductase